MPERSGLVDTLRGIGDGLIRFVVDFVPRFVTGLVILLVGWILAHVVRRVLDTAFVRLRVDHALERLGVTAMLQGLGVRGSMSKGTAKLAYWLVLVLFLKSAALAMGLLPVADAITSFFDYLPRLLAAFLVMLFGSVLARVAGEAVQRAAGESGVDYAKPLGRAVNGGIVFVVAVMAITQLGIDTQMIRTVVVIALSGLALGLALSFGLGSREVTRNLMAGFYARKLYRVGAEMEVRGERGTLAAVTPTSTLLSRDGSVVSVPNQVFLQEVARQEEAPPDPNRTSSDRTD